MYYRLFSIPFSYTPSINTGLTGSNQFIQPIFPIPIIGYKQDSSSNESNVPQSVAHLICVPQVPQMWHKMWHNSIYILSTNQYMSMKIRDRKIGRERSSKVKVQNSKNFISQLLVPMWTPVPHFVPHLWHLWHTYQMCHTLWHIGVPASILRTRHNVRGWSELIGQGVRQR